MREITAAAVTETVAALKNSYDDVLAAFFTNTAAGKKKNGGKSA